MRDKITVNGFVEINNKTKPETPLKMVNTLASFTDNLPDGKARFFVLSIKLSYFTSSIWLIVTAAPDIKNPPKKSNNSVLQSIAPGVPRIYPKTEENAPTMDSLGFHNEINAPILEAGDTKAVLDVILLFILCYSSDLESLIIIESSLSSPSSFTFSFSYGRFDSGVSEYGTF